MFGFLQLAALRIRTLRLCEYAACGCADMQLAAVRICSLRLTVDSVSVNYKTTSLFFFTFLCQLISTNKSKFVLK